MNFAFAVDQKVKIKESKKRYKYLDLARELKILSMTVTVIPIVLLLSEPSPKAWLKVGKAEESEDKSETIQTTALFRSVRILRKVLETKKDFLLLRLQLKTIS